MNDPAPPYTLALTGESPELPDLPRTDLGLAEADRYVYEGLLGTGGMGEVHRVWDRRLERFLALKRMRAGLAASSVAVARFHNERRVTAGLDHPGVVVVFDAGASTDGRPWYTMRLVDGHQTLRTALRGLATNAALTALAQIANAMRFAHARGVIHRDLKPDNLLLGGAGEVLVIDWGIARRGVSGALPTAPFTSSTVELPASGATVQGGVLGTAPYFAPEQALGLSDAHGPWSDVWSLGAILWEILAGRPLSRERSRDRGASALPWAGEEPPELRTLVEACLAWAPADRPTMGRVAATLHAWIEAEEARTRALALVRQAAELEPLRHARQEAADALARRARERLAAIGARGPAAEKAEGWALEDEAEAARIDAAVLAAELEQSLQAALRLSPGLAAAEEPLADLYAARARDAEAAGDRVRFAGAERLLRQYDRGRWSAWLSGEGAVSIVTDPPGAEIRIARFVLRDRRLVPEPLAVHRSPLHALPLPRGSYLAELHADGHVPVRYPFVVGRGEHWDGVPPGSSTPAPIVLPRLGALDADEVYVPPGFAILGDERAANGLPRARVWVDGFCVRRAPVTVGAWLAWLDHLAATGSPLLDDALPRGSGDPTGPVARVDGRHTLVPDEQGDLWDLDWPVVLVGWRTASAYAAFEAARTGRPWRLVWELEREKAARGVDGRSFPWGEQPEVTWFHNALVQTGRARPSAVGRYPEDVSVYGMADAAGNTRDWCLDLRAVPPEVREGRWMRPAAAPEGEGDAWRVARGGFWSGGVDYGRPAGRVGAPESLRHGTFSVRLGRGWP